MTETNPSSIGSIRTYKGKFKVKIITKSNGNILVEALEDFSKIKKGHYSQRGTPTCGY